MSRRTITIPAPIARYGAEVLVRNYRRSGRWEEGTIGALSYGTKFGGALAWTYEVCLDRLPRLRLYVGDDALRRVAR